MEPQHGARVIAAQRYRLSTLAVHDHLFVTVLRGRKVLHSGDTALRAIRGQGVMVARGTRWDVVNDPLGQSRYEAVVLSLDDELVRESGALSAAAEARVVERAEVLPVDEELREAMLRTLPATSTKRMSAPLQRHRTMEVLLLLAERGYRFAAVGDSDWSDRLRRMVAQRPHADWNVEALAAAFGVSESTLRRRMENSGTTLAALVREVRLETALGLLQTTGLRVGDVAQRCGWESHSRFSAAFQERWGVPPSVVRSRMTETAQAVTETG